RFRSTLGYEFLSGTSQATPFVAGAVAELLARGVSPSEIYGRLVLGSRPLQNNLGLVENIAASAPSSLRDSAPSDKYFLAGQLDVQSALKVSPRSVIIPASKEKIALNWNRQQTNLDVEVRLINKWQAVS